MWIAIAFIGFIASTGVAGIIAEAMKKKAKLEVLRAAIEKGQVLDPALVDQLMLSEKEPVAGTSVQVAVNLQIGAIMTLALAAGTAILGYALSGFDNGRVLSDMGVTVFRTSLGTAALLLCLSIGMFAASWVVRSQRKPGNQGA